MVFRVFVEKKEELAGDARALLKDVQGLLAVKSAKKIRIFNRYDCEGISEELFTYAKKTVFSEPQLDIVYKQEEFDRTVEGLTVFNTEYLPGQFDQRADSAAQCISLISQGEKPLVRSAFVYAIEGELSESELNSIKNYVINPVEAREASGELPETLRNVSEEPVAVDTCEGFIKLDREGLTAFSAKLGLAMDADDLEFCRKYFESENRDPSITEIRVIDTYWSDHCRHTTFNTEIDSVVFGDKLHEKTYNEYIETRKRLGRTKPICLMDLATVATRDLKKRGLLDKLDESDEINACTVNIEVETDGRKEPWLLLFKNETHNHPTEIEPFGGAATCIGGAIRDPLSGRSYVYGAMRVTGAADPLKSFEETLPGKLPQRKLVTTAAAGYASYGNQIGLATGIVDEIYHPGYAAKRMEIGAVIGAAPKANVRREVPAPGDIVILLGGATGRDGIGGATGSSKSHDVHSVEKCGAEVQKGNAPEERKLQRLFRNAEASRLIKRCNDFGAGGVSVAIGELADGLTIDLDKVPKKYSGLDGTELAISESQERMAVVVAPEDAARFIELAYSENLNAVKVAVVTEEKTLRMNWKGNCIVELKRSFLDTNGAAKHINIETEKSEPVIRVKSAGFVESMKELTGDLNTCSKRGLSERFDSTIGAGTVLMPFGGSRQLTPVQAMVQKISVEKSDTDDCSLMSYGYNPFISEKSPYHGAYLAVIESVCKLIATGAEFKDVYLTFQEYFGRPGTDAKRWGKPFSALLGAFAAQEELKIAAIGGKDSMSGTFEKLDVPPTLVSFAVTTSKTGNIVSHEFKKAGDTVIVISPEYDENGLPETESLLKVFECCTELFRTGKAVAGMTPGLGGVADAVYKMSLGEDFGFTYNNQADLDELFGYSYGSFVLELNGESAADAIIENLRNSSVAKGYAVKEIGKITEEKQFVFGTESVATSELLEIYEGKLEPVYTCNIPAAKGDVKDFEYSAKSDKAVHEVNIKKAAPKILIPVFPGTNCEFDSAKAVREAGAEAEIFVIRNINADAVKRSIEELEAHIKSSQAIFIPGGFSGGDEPDGSGKFITAVFRNEAVKNAVTGLLNDRDGLMCGVCNGFQALIKLGLVPYGRIMDTDASCPTLTFNNIGRHQSRIVRTRVASNKSPWLSYTEVGEIYNVPISHGEGKFLADEKLIEELASNGQIATQYVDLEGHASMDVHFNPNGSMYAIEGITSPDGRVFGKMGHSERIGKSLYKNVSGEYDIRMFKSAVEYMTK